MEWTFEKYIISNDKKQLDINVIKELLSTSYWAKDRTLEQIKTTIKSCECFGVYHSSTQIGFARVLTDYVCLFYVFDVIIHPDYRGKGLGKKLMQCIVNNSHFKNLRGMLATQDAHGLYEKYGFKKINDRLMFRNTL